VGMLITPSSDLFFPGSFPNSPPLRRSGGPPMVIEMRPPPTPLGDCKCSDFLRRISLSSGSAPRARVLETNLASFLGNPPSETVNV